MNDKIGTVRKLSTGLENLRRFGVFKTLTAQVGINPILSDLDGIPTEAYEGMMFDFAHLVVLSEGYNLPSASASVDELARGFMDFVNRPIEETNALRAEIANAEKEPLKKNT